MDADNRPGCSLARAKTWAQAAIGWSGIATLIKDGDGRWLLAFAMLRRPHAGA